MGQAEDGAMGPRYDRWHALLLCLWALVFTPPAFPTQPGAGPLDRGMDPVLVRGDSLQAFLGARLNSLRLLRYRDGRYEAIRFQVDERTPEGDWIFPHGKKNNGAESNGLLDPRDVLLFMARDAGTRAGPEAELRKADRVIEIGLKDPVDGAAAWVYLAAYGTNPPPLCPLPDYVRYNYETEEVVSDVSYYKFIITEDGLHTGFSDVGAILPEAGGDGRNRIDRMKTRIQIRFFFNLIPLSLDEETLGQDVVAYITGPIRVIRRLEQFFKLPFGLRGMSSLTDLHLYESITIVPAVANIPPGVDKVISSAHIWFGADLAPNAIGSLFRNSENPEPMIVDGRMSEREKRFSPKQDKWRVLYGPGGAMLTRAVFPPDYAEMMEIRQRYLDDISVVEPPERYKGSIGVLKTEMFSDNPKAGRYKLLIEVYFPADYRPGNEASCLKVRDNPLRITINGRTQINQLQPE